jgi:steroid 5-alpha reductase family enzyme
MTLDSLRTAAGLIAAGWVVAAALMLALWWWHLRIRNAGVVDFGWTASLAMLAALYAAAAPGDLRRRWLIAGMTIVWASRLAFHLLRDRILGQPEDPRYADLRARGSVAAALRFLPFFQIQAALAVLFSIAVLIPAFNPAPRLQAIEAAAVALWALAFAGEALADRQLARFKRRPDSRGRTCREGLWRYSRHPNYFFEWLAWVAFALFALGSPGGVAVLICPALMLYFLLRVTGIPATEAQALRSRGDDYRRYQRTTSAFVPWPPRSAS